MRCADRLETQLRNATRATSRFLGTGLVFVGVFRGYLNTSWLMITSEMSHCCIPTLTFVAKPDQHSNIDSIR